VRGVDQSEAVKFERKYLGYKNILKKKKLFLQISIKKLHSYLSCVGRVVLGGRRTQWPKELSLSR
jgi:hypothetical protein